MTVLSLKSMSYWGFNKALQKSLSDAYANVK